MNREDIRGGVERLRSLEEKAQRLEGRFPSDDLLNIWAKETKDMIHGFAGGHKRGYATFLDPILSLLDELLRRKMKKEAKPFARLVGEIVQGLSKSPADIPGWEFGITGGDDAYKQQGGDD